MIVNEKYVDVRVGLEGMEEPELVEVYVRDDEIRHYIDTYATAEDVLNYAQQIDSSLFNDDKVNLDLAYELLIDEFDEHDDIEDLRDLHEYIQDCIETDYHQEAEEKLLTMDEDQFDDMEEPELEDEQELEL